MCSIAYEPCNDQSFKIGPSMIMNPNFNSLGSYGNANLMNPNGLNGFNPVNGLADMNNLNSLNNLNMASLANQNAAALMNSKFMRRISLEIRFNRF